MCTKHYLQLQILLVQVQILGRSLAIHLYAQYWIYLTTFTLLNVPPILNLSV